jgi:hypothetical protein
VRRTPLHFLKLRRRPYNISEKEIQNRKVKETNITMLVSTKSPHQRTTIARRIPPQLQFFIAACRSQVSQSRSSIEWSVGSC